MKKPFELMESFLAHFDGATFMKAAKSYLRSSGMQVVYAVLLLYFAYNKPGTPSWAKRIILGAFAYVLAPMDAIPDLSPFLGFTDDLGVLMFGIVSVAGHIDTSVKVEARDKLQDWFGEVDHDEISKVDQKIG